MNKQFYLHFDGGMPKGTAQQKGIRYVNGKPQFYEKRSVYNAKVAFLRGLKANKPPKPSDKPVRLFVWFAFDTKNKKLWGKYKPTRPDTDNSLKLLKDCMSGLFYSDDSQVVDERVVKTYAEKATIMVKVEDIDGELATFDEVEAYDE